VRAASLAALRSGAARILVASDAMARGMDVEGVGAVVNYDPPTNIKAYVEITSRDLAELAEITADFASRRGVTSDGGALSQ
jgi:hypothetical protein